MKNRFGSSLVKIGGALGLLLLLAGAASAQAPIRVDTTAGPVEAAGVEVKDGAVLLSLDEAVEIALRQNLGLTVQRYTRAEARLGVDQTLGIYDLLANATALANDTKSPTVSALQASQSNRQEFNFGFAQLLPNGGQVSVGWDNARSESNNAFARLNPAFSSGLTFAYKQPLLQSFGRLATERQILLAQNRSQSSRQEFERQLTGTVQQVIDAYWSLVGARQQLVVAQESLSLAKELHERNRIQVEVGTKAPLEMVQSEAAIAEREEGIITAQSAVGDAEDQLRHLLNLPEGPLWETEIRPVTDPAVEHAPIDLEASIRTALEERPELHTQQLDVERARIEAAFARNQEKPSLSLDLSYGFSGVGGNVIIRDNDTGEIIDTIPGGFGDALDQVAGFGFRGWSAQLTFGYPLQNRAARAARAIADVDLERSKAAVEDLRNGIITEVRQAARQVETAAKQIDAARASKVFQERNLDAERKRYENGMSTSFQITQIQDDLTQARSREVNAVVNYRTALANYQRTLGRLLKEEGVEIDDQEAAVKRFEFSLFHR